MKALDRACIGRQTGKMDKKQRGRTAKQDRHDRLAEALRANLQRRKQGRKQGLKQSSKQDPEQARHEIRAKECGDDS